MWFKTIHTHAQLAHSYHILECTIVLFILFLLGSKKRKEARTLRAQTVVPPPAKAWYPAFRFGGESFTDGDDCRIGLCVWWVFFQVWRFERQSEREKKSKIWRTPENML